MLDYLNSLSAVNGRRVVFGVNFAIIAVVAAVIYFW